VVNIRHPRSTPTTESLQGARHQRGRALHLAYGGYEDAIAPAFSDVARSSSAKEPCHQLVNQAFASLRQYEQEMEQSAKIK